MDKLNVGIEELGNGELLELANDELKRVYADIRDPNKLAGSAREVNIKITLAAPEKRKSAKIKYSVSSKLGVREGGECQIYLQGEGNDIETALAPLNQQNLFDNKQAS